MAIPYAKNSNDAGVIRRVTIQSLSSIAQGTSASVQQEVDIPNYGDLIGFEVHLTAVATGTLTGAKTFDYAIAAFDVRDCNRNPIFNAISGPDLRVLEKNFGNMGINTTVSATTNSAQTRRYFIPSYIDKNHLVGKLQVTIAPYSAMATSGATGGTVSVVVVGLYSDGATIYTSRYYKQQFAIVSGTNALGQSVPRGRLVNRTIMYVATEANLTDVSLSRDGGLELQNFSVGDMIAWEQTHFVSGHTTNEVFVPHSAYLPTSTLLLNVAASSSDTLSVIYELLDEPVSAGTQ